MKSKKKTYRVKEIFYTLQGEGAQQGRAAVFCRFSGCNLWSGRERDRERAICKFCDTDFIGTDGVNGGIYRSAGELALKIARVWRERPLPPIIAESAPSGGRSADSTPALKSDPDKPMGGGAPPADSSSPSKPCSTEEAGPELDPPPESLPLVVMTGGEPLLQLDRELTEELHRLGFQVAVETNGTLPLPPGVEVDWLCVSPKAGTRLRLTSGDELKLVYPQEGLSPSQFESLRFRHFFLQPMDGPELGENIRAAVLYCLQNPRWRLSLQMHKIIEIP